MIHLKVILISEASITVFRLSFEIHQKMLQSSFIWQWSHIKQLMKKMFIYLPVSCIATDWSWELMFDKKQKHFVKQIHLVT